MLIVAYQPYYLLYLYLFQQMINKIVNLEIQFIIFCSKITYFVSIRLAKEEDDRPNNIHVVQP